MVPLQLCRGPAQLPTPRLRVQERESTWVAWVKCLLPTNHQWLGEVSCSRNMSCGFAIWVILRDNGAGKSSNRCSCQMISNLQKEHLLASQLCRLSLDLTLPDKFQPITIPGSCLKCPKSPWTPAEIPGCTISFQIPESAQEFGWSYLPLSDYSVAPSCSSLGWVSTSRALGSTHGLYQPQWRLITQPSLTV